MGRRKKVKEEEINEKSKKLKRRKIVGAKTYYEILEEQKQLKELKSNE